MESSSRLMQRLQVHIKEKKNRDDSNAMASCGGKETLGEVTLAQRQASGNVLTYLRNNPISQKLN